MRFLGAGWPDYPWLFGTDGEYTAFASVAVGQFEPIKDHLRALRRVSLITNGNSGKVVHEVMHDGSVFFGANADDGNTDETAKFPSAVALLWRWTGDDGWLDEMYRYSVSNLRYIFRELDDDGDGWPEGLANVERAGMGEEKLDSTVYTIRGLWDVVDMAEARGDRVTERWAREKARDLTQRFDAEWWMPEVPQHADSLGEDNEQIQQRHWIGATPMEVELTRGGLPVPGLTTRARGNAALDLRETECYGDETGMWHTGEPGCDGAPPTPSELHAYTLNTAIAAVAEGNYGRLGTDQQQRWTTANRRLQLPVADEQPGAMPEIASPSPLDGTTIDRPFNERPSVLQAWGAYGTAWPVVHQQLGVSPDLGRGRLRVVPQVPEGQRVVIGRDIRLGDGRAQARARLGERRDLRDRGRRRRPGGADGRPRAAAQRGRAAGDARRPPDPRLRHAADQPRPRGHRRGGARRAAGADHHDGLRRARAAPGSAGRRAAVPAPLERPAGADRPRLDVVGRRDRLELAGDRDRVELWRLAEPVQRGQDARPDALGGLLRPGDPQAAPAEPAVERPHRATVIVVHAEGGMGAGERAQPVGGQHVGLAQALGDRPLVLGSTPDHSSQPSCEPAPATGVPSPSSAITSGPNASLTAADSRAAAAGHRSSPLSAASARRPA